MPSVYWNRMAAAPSAIVCLKKEKLLREFAKAVSDYHRMQSAQLAALLKGQDFMFQAEIAEASDRKEQAKYAILEHRQEHGC